MNSILLQHVPKNWRIERLGRLFSERKEKVSDEDFEPLSVTKSGIVPQMEHVAKSDDRGNRKKVCVGDFVINSRSDRKGSSGLSDYDGSVSLISIVLEPCHGHPRFLHHLMKSYAFQEEFYRFGHGIVADLWTTRFSEMKGIQVGLPDLTTQKVIADFLDRETIRIDQLTGKKERLLELLGDKLTAVIEILVTGRNRSDFQSDAGRFVKGMPRGWLETRVRFGISKIEQGWSPQCEDRLISNDEWGVLKLGAITTGVFREEAYKALPSDLAPRPEYAVRPGDVLIARASGSPAMVGKACYVDAISRNLMISDKHYRIYLSNARFMPEFFVYLINSRQSRAQIEVRLSSAEGMARNIGQDVIKNVWCAVPGYPEQLEIVRQIKSSERSVYATLTSTTRSIDRLMEFRAALITAAVTGQIDVATWGKRGETDRRLDDIESNMAAAVQPERQQVRA